MSFLDCWLTVSSRVIYNIPFALIFHDYVGFTISSHKFKARITGNRMPPLLLQNSEEKKFRKQIWCPAHPNNLEILLCFLWFSTSRFNTNHDDVINGNIFRVTGHLCGEFTGPGEFKIIMHQHLMIYWNLCNSDCTLIKVSIYIYMIRYIFFFILDFFLPSICTYMLDVCTVSRMVFFFLIEYWESTHRGLSHWSRDKMDAISQTTFSNANSWMKSFKFRLKFHWSLFHRVQLTIFQRWFT